MHNKIEGISIEMKIILELSVLNYLRGGSIEGLQACVTPRSLLPPAKCVPYSWTKTLELREVERRRS